MEKITTQEPEAKQKSSSEIQAQKESPENRDSNLPGIQAQFPQFMQQPVQQPMFFNQSQQQIGQLPPMFESNQQFNINNGSNPAAHGMGMQQMPQNFLPMMQMGGQNEMFKFMMLQNPYFNQQFNQMNNSLNQGKNGQTQKKPKKKRANKKEANKELIKSNSTTNFQVKEEDGLTNSSIESTHQLQQQQKEKNNENESKKTPTQESKQIPVNEQNLTTEKKMDVVEQTTNIENQNDQNDQNIQKEQQQQEEEQNQNNNQQQQQLQQEEKNQNQNQIEEKAVLINNKNIEVENQSDNIIVQENQENTENTENLKQNFIENQQQSDKITNEEKIQEQEKEKQDTEQTENKESLPIKENLENSMEEENQEQKTTQNILESDKKEDQENKEENENVENKKIETENQENKQKTKKKRSKNVKKEQNNNSILQNSQFPQMPPPYLSYQNNLMNMGMNMNMGMGFNMGMYPNMMQQQQLNNDQTQNNNNSNNNNNGMMMDTNQMMFNPFLFQNPYMISNQFGMDMFNQQQQQNTGSSSQSGSKKKKCKFDTKNLVKNFLNSFLTFVQTSEEEKVVMDIMKFTEKDEIIELRTELKNFFKGKKFNRVLLKEFIFIEKFRPLFQFYLEKRAPNWIETGRMKDKPSHQRALKNFTYVCQNYDNIKSWRFRYNFV